MVLRDIQLCEVIVGKLDLGAVENFEAHGDENVLGLVQRLVHRVAVAQLHGRAGDGHVDGLGLQLRLERLFLQLGADGLNLFLNGGADVVRGLTHDRALFRGQLAHHLEDAGQFALFAEKAHAQRVQLARVLDTLQRAQRFLPDFFQLFFHKRRSPFRDNTESCKKNKPSVRLGDERPCFRGTTRCSQQPLRNLKPVTAAGRRVLLAVQTAAPERRP